MNAPTPFPDVNNVVALLRDGLTAILRPRPVALYLTGSLAYGDFDEGSSDIDLFVVLGERLGDDQRRELEALHLSIEAEERTWAGRIETTYVLRNMLREIEPPREARPYFNQGRLWKPDPTYGYEWLLQLAAVREFGISAFGPKPSALIPAAVSNARLREASALDLRKEWEPALRDDGYLASPHVRAYAVLTLCRVLYRQQTGGFATKRTAAAWAADGYPRWRSLVTDAMSWQHGRHFSAPADVAAFIRYTLEEVIAETL